jgi:prepilin-type N-terminal cleavage/methylation domain-containing protein
MRYSHSESPNNLRNEHGFTLIETMIALVVFSIGILAAMTMTTNAMKGYSRSRLSTTEVNRTCLNLEAVKQAGYTELDVFSDIQGGVHSNSQDAIVRGTRLIVMQNDAIKGKGEGGAYQVYYTKPLIQ